MRVIFNCLVLSISILLLAPRVFADGSGVGTMPLSIPITQSASEQNMIISKIGSQIGLLIQSTPPGLLQQSSAGAQKILQNYQEFMAAKTTCAKNAEIAETLCIESKSPQAQIAKSIVDNAGPILALVSSAQKACSSTADMTTLASEAASLAKGACVSAKTLCDSSCSTAGKSLESLLAFSKAYVPAAHLEIKKVMATTVELASEEMILLESADLAVNNYDAAYPETIGSEIKVLPIGTTGSIVGRCQGYAKDVVLFAINLGNLLNANQSAKDCAAKLATNTGSPTSKAQYCEVPANAVTSFCVCQKDNNAAGCPGSIGKTGGVDKTKDETGKNIKDSSGKNQFAGGFDPVKPQSVDLGKLNSEDKAKSENGDSANSKIDGGIGANAAAGGGPGSASGAHGAGDSSKDASLNPEDKKKWSFGSFLGIGGGGSSSGRSGSGSAGSLGKKEFDGIQRAIASEKLRAEISGAAGKSNWEKVNERYLRNSPSLLSGQ